MLYIDHWRALLYAALIIKSALYAAQAAIAACCCAVAQHRWQAWLRLTYYTAASLFIVRVDAAASCPRPSWSVSVTGETVFLLYILFLARAGDDGGGGGTAGH